MIKNTDNAKKKLTELLSQEKIDSQDDYLNEVISRVKEGIKIIENINYNSLAESFDECLDEEYDEPGYAENFKLKKPAAYKKQFKNYVDEWVKNSLQCLSDDLNELDYYLKEKKPTN